MNFNLSYLFLCSMLFDIKSKELITVLILNIFSWVFFLEVLWLNMLDLSPWSILRWYLYKLWFNSKFWFFFWLKAVQLLQHHLLKGCPSSTDLVFVHLSEISWYHLLGLLLGSVLFHWLMCLSIPQLQSDDYRYIINL